MYESLEEMLNMPEFDKDLQEELTAAYPNTGFINVLSSAKRDLVRNDCGIIVTATATVCRIRHSNVLMLKAYTKEGLLLKDEEFDNIEHMKSVVNEYTDISHMKQDIKESVFYTDVYLPVPILKVDLYFSFPKNKVIFKILGLYTYFLSNNRKKNLQIATSDIVLSWTFVMNNKSLID
ncbi:unnamed protein product [Mytilus edulis]|uniref:Uncharacterized protein n=1 Tax=Mytilus edulis TaxID=6550 RepID=A0A8S3UI48_MYTED|nr:unnamed protein product [Mytilus edulis]